MFIINLTDNTGVTASIVDEQDQPMMFESKTKALMYLASTMQYDGVSSNTEQVRYTIDNFNKRKMT